MKKTIFIILFLLPFYIFSQTTAFEKFGNINSIETPYLDKTDMIVNHSKITVTESDWLNFKLNKLEEFDPDFVYNVYGKIDIDGIVLLLFERKYTEESNHWAVLFKEEKYISHLNIAYHNSQGFLYIESDITADKITVKETSSFDVKEYSETSYSINESGFQKCK